VNFMNKMSLILFLSQNASPCGAGAVGVTGARTRTDLLAIHIPKGMIIALPNLDTTLPVSAYGIWGSLARAAATASMSSFSPTSGSRTVRSLLAVHSSAAKETAEFCTLASDSFSRIKSSRVRTSLAAS